MIQKIIRWLFFKVYHSKRMTEAQRLPLAFAVAAFDGLVRYVGLIQAISIFQKVVSLGRIKNKKAVVSEVRNGERSRCGGVREREVQTPIQQVQDAVRNAELRQATERTGKAQKGEKPSRRSIRLICPDCDDYMNGIDGSCLVCGRKQP
jgi:hypothetical protein